MVDPSYSLPAFSLLTCDEKIDNANNQICISRKLKAEDCEVHDDLDESDDQI